jgi:TPR repeat protein
MKTALRMGVCVIAGAFLMSARAFARDDIATLRAKAESGDIKAQVELGVNLQNGYGVAADQAEAARWYRKAADAGSKYGPNTGSGRTLTMSEPKTKHLTRLLVQLSKVRPDPLG